jgi:serine/threonine protein kinase
LVAVKELLSPDETEFKKEVDVLKMLDSQNPHLNLIQLLATFKQGNKYHLIFPWAQGNLRKYWEENANPKFDKSTVMWSLEQMAGITNALMNVHTFTPKFPHDGKSGVRLTGTAKLSVEAGEEKFGRHGDIKPENILWFKDEPLNQHGNGVLKLADFGLGRFHGRDSRSGLSPSGIRASPTYEPPECQLHLPVSRSYDIWSLGCVLLEFVTWLMKGNSEIVRFSEFRGTVNIYGIDDDNFFTIMHPTQPNKAIIRTKVVDWVRQLREHERCSELIHDLLSTIMTDLLLIDSSCRISADELNRKMQKYCEKARHVPDYMLKPNPSSATSLPGLLTADSSLPTPQQPINDQQMNDLQTPGITVNGVLLASPRIPEILTFNNLLNQSRRNGTWPPTGRRDQFE